MKRLYLLRHAKTEPHSPEGDHERELTERGRADAALMARQIARRGYSPELILASSSRRTMQTLEIVLPHLSPTPEARLEPALYLAPANSIFQRAGAVGGATHAVLFIGHNPGMEDLALQLAGDSDLGTRVAEKFPTACFAAFQSDAATWTAALRGRWTALDILRPAELRS
jgi:phosphohistidine phosphatase